MKNQRKKYDYYFGKVQKQIFYCYNCQAFDSGDMIWVQGDQISMIDLMWDCGVPEQYQEEIADSVYCPNCGTGNFGLGAEVGLRTQFEKELSAAEIQAKKIYERDIKTLENLLNRFPFLALDNKFGRKLYKEIKGKKMPEVEVTGIFYRARVGKYSKIMTDKDMAHSPLGKSSEGRFNHAGQSHLYLSSEKSLAQLEVASRDCLVWHQRWKLKRPVSNILDLTFDWDEKMLSTSALLVALNVGRALSKRDGNVENWRPDYFITRYIMDCAKAVGYAGIKYDSARGIGYNLVLFYPDQVRFLKSKPVISKFQMGVTGRIQRKIAKGQVGDLF